MAGPRQSASTQRDAGESCDTCGNDCFSEPGGFCGNGVCEPSLGEDCLSCAADCRGKQNGKPSGRYCCGDGAGENPVGCGDNRCTQGADWLCSGTTSSPSQKEGALSLRAPGRDESGGVP